MLMDDTVILATSREQCVKKLEVVLEFCSQSGMVLNQAKTKFMVINAAPDDRNPIAIFFEGKMFNIDWCDSYVYLGSIFTTDGKIFSAIQNCAMDAKKHFMKFVTFLNKNPDYPFFVKHKVMNSAFLAAILYGCEGWLIDNIAPMNKLYISSIKALLAVRQTTSNDACLLELGYPPLKYWVKERQYQFFKSAISRRTSIHDDPLMFAITLAKGARTKAGQYLIGLLDGGDYFKVGINVLKDTVANSTRSKLIAYQTMNPELDVHGIYRQRQPIIPEHQRMAFTRLRLVSHRLRIETGRWARIPQEERLCICGEVQTERHVVCDCELSRNIRDLNPHMTFRFPNFFFNMNSDICRVVYDILQLYM